MILALALQGAGAIAAQPDRAIPLLRLAVPNGAAVQALVDQGLDVAAVRPQADGFSIYLVGHPDDRAAIAALPYPATVQVPDLVARALAVAADYRDLTDYEQELQAIAADHPEVARLTTIGRSLERRPIHALELASPVDREDGRPEAVFMGLHHGGEWASGELVMSLANDLAAKFGRESRITKLIKKNRIWLVPVVNPDGFVHSRTVAPLWRKNRRDNGNGTFGVDINRNYAMFWGGPGSSSSTSSETYRGPAPFSEPETTSVRDLFLRRHLIISASNHSFGDLVLHPWGFTTDCSPEQSTLAGLAGALADFNGYTPGPISQTVALTSGAWDDWNYGALAGIGLTFEHGCCEHHPAYEQVEAWYAKNYPAYLYLAEQARKRASRISGKIKNAATGQAVHATLTLSRSYSVPTAAGPVDTATRTTTLESKSNGAFQWYVLPSAMPLETSDPGYTLRVNADGYRDQTLTVTIGRGEKKTVNVALVPVRP